MQQNFPLSVIQVYEPEIQDKHRLLCNYRQDNHYTAATLISLGLPHLQELTSKAIQTGGKLQPSHRSQLPPIKEMAPSRKLLYIHECHQNPIFCSSNEPHASNQLSERDRRADSSCATQSKTSA